MLWSTLSVTPDTFMACTTPRETSKELATRDDDWSDWDVATSDIYDSVLAGLHTCMAGVCRHGTRQYAFEAVLSYGDSAYLYYEH